MAPRPVRSEKPRRAAPKRPSPRMLPRAQVAGTVRKMAAPAGTARFAAGKALCVTARKDPGRVYPHFAEIAALLGSDSKIVRWNAIQLIGLLAPADTDRKLDAHLDGYLRIVAGGNLISAANAIQGAVRIACARPDLLDRIIPAVLAVERATYETAECRDVAIGQTLNALQEAGPSLCGRPDVAGFVRRQMSNPRPAVARKAAQMAADMRGGA